MNRKVVGDIKGYFESYELMSKLLDENVKVISYLNENKQTLHIQIVERVSREDRKLFGRNLRDNLFCEFKLNYNKAKFTFKVRPEKINIFHNQLKGKVRKKYKCEVIGTNVSIELYNPSLQEVMDIFIEIEKLCRRK